MSKRSFLFGTLVIIAGLASATPSYASSVITTTVSFQAANPGLTEIDFTYSASGGIGTLGPATPVPPVVLPFDGLTAISGPTGDVVKLSFGGGDTGPFPTSGTFTFTMTDSNNNPVSALPSILPAGVSLTNFSFSVSQSGVPEPASLALLGIGMTGLLAFRRFFKKTSVA